MTFEATYYRHKATGAIEAEGIQALLNASLAAGGTHPGLGAPFSRLTGGQ